jgi:hypothetical protein
MRDSKNGKTIVFQYNTCIRISNERRFNERGVQVMGLFGLKLPPSTDRLWYHQAVDSEPLSREFIESGALSLDSTYWLLRLYDVGMQTDSKDNCEHVRVPRVHLQVLREYSPSRKEVPAWVVSKRDELIHNTFSLPECTILRNGVVPYEMLPRSVLLVCDANRNYVLDRFR